MIKGFRPVKDESLKNTYVIPPLTAYSGNPFICVLYNGRNRQRLLKCHIKIWLSIFRAATPEWFSFICY